MEGGAHFTRHLAERFLSLRRAELVDVVVRDHDELLGAASDAVSCEQLFAAAGVRGRASRTPCGQTPQSDPFLPTHARARVS